MKTLASLIVFLLAATLFAVAPRAADSPRLGGEKIRIEAAHDVVFARILEDGSVLALHDDARWTLSVLDAATTTITTATAAAFAIPQGPQSVPSITVTFVDAMGQKIVTSVPIVSATDADIERCAKLLKRLNEEMRRTFPPAPSQPQ